MKAKKLGDRGKAVAKTLSAYALENQRRQRAWEQGFRERIEWLIDSLGGPGAVQELAHIKSQSFQKVRKGGSRLAFFATLVEVSGVNAIWLLLGSHSEPRFRGGRRDNERGPMRTRARPGPVVRSPPSPPSG